MITVFFDDKCGLCSREIAYYKRIAPTDFFKWVEISSGKERLMDANISEVDALLFLHAVDGAGRLHIGVDAFIIIWRELSYWGLVASLVSLPLIYPLIKLLYLSFARYRFSRLAHCEVALQKGS